MWRKQSVLECFEVDSRLCHTSCTLSGLRPTTTLSPRQARAPDTPKSQNLMPLIYIPGQQNYQTQLHERRHITAVNTRKQDLGNELERLALLAQSSLPQCSREFRNVITPPQTISYVITRQDGCHKLTFLRKGDQYFVTLNDRPWQWKRTGTMKHWHARREIWNLNSHGSAFSVPNPQHLWNQYLALPCRNDGCTSNFYLGQRYLRKVWYYSRSFRPLWKCCA